MNRVLLVALLTVALSACARCDSRAGVTDDASVAPLGQDDRLEVPASWPKDILPPYPGATLVYAKEGPPSMEVRWETSDPTKAVFDFYLPKLTGFEKVDEKEGLGGNQSVKLARSGEEVLVHVARRPDRGVISLRFTRGVAQTKGGH